MLGWARVCLVFFLLCVCATRQRARPHLRVGASLAPRGKNKGSREAQQRVREVAEVGGGAYGMRGGVHWNDKTWSILGVATFKLWPSPRFCLIFLPSSKCWDDACRISNHQESRFFYLTLSLDANKRLCVLLPLSSSPLFCIVGHLYDFIKINAISTVYQSFNSFSEAAFYSCLSRFYRWCLNVFTITLKF